MAKRICLGQIVGAHGVKGDVKIRSFTSDPSALEGYGGLQDEGGKEIRLKVKSAAKDIVIAQIIGVTSREAAEALAKAKAQLYVTREQLGEAAEGEYFFEDLKGLKALDEAGKEIASVRDVVNYGAGDILVLNDNKGEFMLPFKPPFAGKVDLKAGTLQIMVPEGWRDIEEMNHMWHAHILTLFPEMFPGPLGQSLAGKALAAGVWKLSTHQIRDYALDKHKNVDDTPYGGGAGMVMKADVVNAALEALTPGTHVVYLSPRGTKLTQEKLKELARLPELALLCGRYEGVDQRVIEAREIEEISLGDFVLAGGEVAAMALIEGVVRLLPGVMGNETSGDEESFSEGLLEYPHYTRPAEWQGLMVPDVLVSGDHARVKAWRREKAEELTKLRRPDLWDAYKGRHK